MKNKKQLLALLLILTMIMSSFMFTGCSKDKETAGQAEEPAEVETVDDAGRTVTVPSPSKIDKVYFTSPIGMIMVYTLAPEKMAGTSMKLTENELKYLDESCKDLEFLGGVQAGAELNKELILSSGTQVIFSMGPTPVNDNSAKDADELQEQLGIPVVVVNEIFDTMPDSYKLMGKILGVEERATKLADYCNNVLKDVKEKVSKIPEKDRITVYYAEGPDGLSTEPDTSGHAAVLKFANAANVATVEGKPGSGMSPVSLEQVLAWDPQVIISWGDQRGGAYSIIKSNPDWANIDAVKNDRVYEMPNTPFSWMDRPPSVNRFLGIQWIANMLYPEAYDVDMVKVVQEFYDLFYHVSLTKDEASDLLKTAM